MNEIGKRKLNWHRIKAEYVTGTSQKKLAEKYHVSRNSMTEKSGGKDRTVLKEVTKAYKLRDLTAAYKDLTDDMNLNANTEPVRIIIDV